MDMMRVKALMRQEIEADRSIAQGLSHRVLKIRIMPGYSRQAMLA
jgi:hypothetical protein